MPLKWYGWPLRMSWLPLRVTKPLGDGVGLGEAMGEEFGVGDGDGDGDGDGLADVDAGDGDADGEDVGEGEAGLCPGLFERDAFARSIVTAADTGDGINWDRNVLGEEVVN
jgi:hypothetical protein